MGAQLQIIPYKKPKKHFFRIARLNRLSLALPCAFGTTATSDSFFVALCNDVGKYFYTGAHLQYMGYKAVVEVFFQVTSGWSKWCAQTLHPFSQILTIFSDITARIVAQPSGNFQICLFRWNGFFFSKKRCKLHLNRPRNTNAISCWSSATKSPVTVISGALYTKKKEKNITLRHLTPRCVARFPRNFARW